MLAELDDRRAVPALTTALYDAEPGNRYAAAEALGRLGGEARAAVSSLKHLVGGDPLPGDRAAEALARMGPEGVAALVELLASDRGEVRSPAAAALRLAGPDVACALPRLVDVLRDPSPAVRQRAAATLGELEQTTPAAIEALEQAREDPELLVRLAAQKSLKKLAAHATFQRQPS
jgi:HEAT repeat protein